MIDAIVCSKDRPLQLYALLESLEANSGDLFSKIKVLYKSSNPEIESGYEIVRSQFDLFSSASQLPCEFFKDGDSFKQSFEQAFDLTTPFHCLFVDDMLFFRKFPANQKYVLDAMKKPDICMFSLRLGLNTNRQKLPSGVATFDLKDYKTDGVSIKWDRTRIQPWFNYNYALTTDACIYRTHQIYSLISRESYKNLNELESKLYTEAYKMPQMMLSCQNSCCVNIPFNIVQTTIDNEINKTHTLEVEELNRRFLAGERLDWQNMDFSGVNCTHQEIEPKFVSTIKLDHWQDREKWRKDGNSVPPTKAGIERLADVLKNGMDGKSAIDIVWGPE